MSLQSKDLLGISLAPMLVEEIDCTISVSKPSITTIKLRPKSLSSIREGGNIRVIASPLTILFGRTSADSYVMYKGRKILNALGITLDFDTLTRTRYISLTLDGAIFRLDGIAKTHTSRTDLRLPRREELIELIGR